MYLEYTRKETIEKLKSMFDRSRFMKENYTQVPTNTYFDVYIGNNYDSLIAGNHLYEHEIKIGFIKGKICYTEEFFKDYEETRPIYFETLLLVVELAGDAPNSSSHEIRIV